MMVLEITICDDRNLMNIGRELENKNLLKYGS